MESKDKTKTAVIGLFVLGAILFLGWMLIFLRPTIGDGKQILTVRFNSIDKITVGTRVSYAGKPVGEVIALKELWDREEAAKDDQLFLYEVTLAIDSGVPVYSTDEFSVKTTGLFGEKSIAITPRPRKRGKSAQIIKGDIVYAESVDPLEGTVNQIYTLSTKMGKALDLIIELIESNEESIDSFSTTFNRIASNLSMVLEQLNQTQAIERLSQAAGAIEQGTREFAILTQAMNQGNFGQSLSSATQHLESILTAVDDPDSLRSILHNISILSKDLTNLHQSFEKLASAGSSFERTSELVQTLAENLIDGKGSLGRFLSDDQFYLQVESVVSKAQALMNDINHYGLLFHHDKNWQRERAKRINLLSDMETAKDFQNYFQEEQGTLETSFSRIEAVLKKVHGAPLNQTVVQPSFQKGFADLLRQVNSLQERLEALNSNIIQEQKAQ